MNKKIIYLLLAFSLSLFVFTACSDDNNDLRLEKNEISVDEGGTATVKITSGNGGYTVTPADATIATATIESNTITIKGVKNGETMLTITDSEKKTTSLKVKVITLAEQAAATYNGDLTIQLEGAESSKKDIVLTTSGENIKMTLASFSLGAIAVSNVVVDEIPLAKGENGAITVVQTTKAITVDVSGTAIPVKVTVSGTITNVIKKESVAPSMTKQLDLTINVTDVPGFEAIPVTFSGTKKAE